MRKKVFQAVAGLCTAMTVVSCAPSALISLGCPPLPELANIKEIPCLINNDHLLQIGNPRPPAIPKGTTVTYLAKLENAGNHCATIKTKKPIPPHLFITIAGQPLLDVGTPCKAWRRVEPVNTQ